MSNRKITLILIIILLIIFVPLAILSTTLHFKNNVSEVINPNHDFQYNGKLYFYDDNDELLGVYNCLNSDYCDYAILRNNYEYNLNEHEEEKNEKVKLIDKRYAFLMDTTTPDLAAADIILYDVVTNKEMGRYLEVKNYGIGIDGDNYLVKNNNGLWGVLQFYDGVNLKIPFKYNYIALANQIDAVTGKILADTFAVLENDSWYLIDVNNNKLTDTINGSIFNYNDEYIIVSENEAMKLVSYDGRNRLFGTYKYLNFCDKYIAIVDNSNILYLYDMKTNKEVSKRHLVTNIDDLSFEITEGLINIRIAEELSETVAIN